MKRKIIAGILLLWAGYFQAYGQAVRLRCTEVLDNGDVVITWNPIAVGTGFYNYTIYHATVLSGPYTELAVITDISQSTHLHTGIAAHLSPSYYYLITNRDSGPSPPSDTLATMVLTGSTSDDEIISLNWTPIHTPLLPAMHPWYLLLREYPPGVETIVDSTQGLSISHHFWECNGSGHSVRFVVGVRDIQTGCISRSDTVARVLRNTSRPAQTVIDSVSIDAAGNAVIGWQPGSEPDIAGYKIFRVTAINDSLDYIDGPNASFYTHTGSNPCSGPLRYVMLAIDSCGSESPFPFDPVTTLPRIYSTIYLQPVQYDPCQMTNALSWNEYENFQPGLGYTNVFVSEDNGPEQLLATIPPGQSDFAHSGLQPHTLYTYYVRAYSSDGLKTSTSCRRQVNSYNSPVPAFLYLARTSVLDDGGTELHFYTDTAAHVQGYQILRGTASDGPFETVGSIQNPGTELVSFTDMTAETGSQSYFYQVEVIDSCGISHNIGNLARTILLAIDASVSGLNALSWNAYESWGGSVEGYRVHRRVNDDDNWELIGETAPGVLTYTDDVTGFITSAGRIMYQVEAVEGDGNLYGFKESSFSNPVLAEQESLFYVPNAIMPYGVNRVFRPVAVFAGPDGYALQVYNRWGQLVFETTDLSQGWDGTFNGKLVESGVYVYLIRFRDSMNRQKVQKGNIAVIY